MKTLVLSLLRLGDFFQQLPLLTALKNSGDEVHVLVNDSLRPVEALFPEFEFHFFPREILQGVLTDSNKSTLGAIHQLRVFVDDINSNRFEAIENWTHNILSARLMDLLDAGLKKGARFQAGRLERDKSGTYMNETWGPSGSASFHWIDALALSMDRAFPEIPRADDHRNGPVLLQVLTSDSKKNWRLGNWKKLANWLRQEEEDVRVLCAPFEKENLIREGFASEILEVCDLAGLRDLLKKAKVLVSGDTSVLHLASHLRTPSLGIFLGSADPRKTAPRALGSKVFWADAGCSPCSHRNPCSQAHHVCGEKMSLQTVQDEVAHMMRKDPQPRLHSQTVRLLEGAKTSSGAFALRDSRRDAVVMWSQLIWEFYLNRDHDGAVAPYGSAAHSIIRGWGGEKSLRAWSEVLSERLELSFRLLEDFSESLWTAMRDFNVEESLSASSETRMREVALQLSVLWRDTDFATRLVESNLSSDANPFVRLRGRKEALQEVYELFTVQKNLIRVIEQELKERSAQHGARA